MITLHLQRGGDGRFAFSADASADALVDAARSVVWFPDELDETPDGVVPSIRNLLMFLSDVRGRKFKRGIFLGEDVLSLVEVFRGAGRSIAEGRMAPDAELCEGGFRAVWRPIGAADAFFTDAIMRTAAVSPLEARPGKIETIHDAWLAALRRDDGFVLWPQPEAAAFVRTLSDWLSPLSLPPEERSRLKFTLSAPTGPEGEWRLICDPPATRAGLTALGQAALVFPPLGGLRGGAAPLTQAEMEAFMRSGAGNLATAGFRVELPDGLVGEHVSAEAELVSPEERGAKGESPTPGGISARLKVRVDGVAVGEDEIEFLLAQHTPFVFFNDHWIEVDRFALQEALKALRASRGRRLTLREAVAFSLGTQRAGRLRIEQVKAHGWLRGLLNELRGEDRFRELPPPEGLKGELRDYQRRGVAWLAFLVRWGFGPLLADDMGLGKTIQTIAWILHFKRSRGTRRVRVLVAAPVSVTTNWTREIARFAPGLSVYLHQGPVRMAGASFMRRARQADVTVTGYSLLVREARDFAAAGFSAIVLDEAQTIKNPLTRVARTVCSLGIPVRIALTGTPLENSVGDLWSLQEFLNPGLLGSWRDFSERFARPIRLDASSDAVRRLKHILEPFLLRRLKTDPGVAAELGEKREVREYCPLSPAQRRRYEAALTSYRDDRAAEAGGESRSARVLALITELKLVCDGDGKFDRLVDLLEDIFAAGESALVFTQYAKVGSEIRSRLEDEFGRRFPFLHGSLAPAQREREIDAFNSSKEPNAFILSLKAGGFGLNLTRATHVIHFDRWWNPAVESQATDRAHRIGQEKTVFVHLFIAPGTLEDHIDELLESKRRVAGEVVGSGEAFLARMSEQELEEVVSLDG